jgi:hypothetical protein
MTRECPHSSLSDVCPVCAGDAVKRTPGPWVCAEDERPRPEIATVCWVGNWVVGVATPGYPCGDYRNIDCDDPAGGADAAFIVRACNSYDTLLSTLDQIELAACVDKDPEALRTAMIHIGELARDVLKGER